MGWVAGLGVALFPWLVAGVISTFLPNPEAMFPWVLLIASVLMVACVVWGTVRVPGFRRGALLGSAISLAFVCLVSLVLLWLQP